MVSLSIAGIFALITAIGGAALAQRLKVTEEPDGDVVLIGEFGEEIARVQQIEERPLNFLDQFLFKNSILSTVTTIPDTPQISIKNPRDTRSVVYSIDFAFDTAFQTNGILQINLNGRKLLSTKPNDFEGISTFSVPFPDKGLFLQKTEKLEVFFWNDGTTVRATTNVSIGDV